MPFTITYCADAMVRASCGGRLVVVRVGVGVGDDARHVGVRAGELLDDAPPEVLGDDDADAPADAAARPHVEHAPAARPRGTTVGRDRGAF